MIRAYLKDFFFSKLEISSAVGNRKMEEHSLGRQAKQK